MLVRVDFASSQIVAEGLRDASLIVESAKLEYKRGTPLMKALLRLRPIIMTSFAFILDCVPLWTGSGSGAVARQVMDAIVIGGMLAANRFF
jgi:HAE1 family hydrophobic/amphiphilic exporter-1